MILLVERPWIAAVVAVALLAAWLWRRLKVTAIGSAVWACYVIYEYMMHARVLCSGECNIRLDLLVLHPLMGIVAAAAVFKTLSTPSR